jgi:hypothetical protein
LLVGDLLHPIGVPAVERFDDGDMSHRAGWRSAMPVLLTRRKPDDIASPDFLDGPTFSLNTAEPGSDDQGLTEWVRVPSCTCSRLESDRCSGGPRVTAAAARCSDPDRARDLVRGAFDGRLRAVALDFHC